MDISNSEYELTSATNTMRTQTRIVNYVRVRCALVTKAIYPRFYRTRLYLVRTQPRRASSVTSPSFSFSTSSWQRLPLLIGCAPFSTIRSFEHSLLPSRALKLNSCTLIFVDLYSILLETSREPVRIVIVNRKSKLGKYRD